MKYLAHSLTIIGLLLLSIGSTLPIPAHAAQSYDNCTGFIDRLPATITTQGTWCLRHDLATSISSGPAIEIATNNVTVDCNDFKLGGLGAGAATQAIGVYSEQRVGVTVRECNIRGFLYGIWLHGSGGGNHLVQDNRFDGDTSAAVVVEGDSSAVRDNQITNTGGSTALGNLASGIQVSGAVDVIDNSIAGVLAVDTENGTGSTTSYGISLTDDDGGSVMHNRVRALGGNEGDAIHVTGSRVIVDGNELVGSGIPGSALDCDSSASVARKNLIAAFDTGIATCTDAGGNYIGP